MTNGAAVGYALMAADELGWGDIPGDQLKKLEMKMLQLMDVKTEEQAEEVYRKN